MLRSFIRCLSCTTPSSADYDLLQNLETAATASAPPLGPITRFPPELVHLVFTFVDPGILAACSLVTKIIPDALSRAVQLHKKPGTRLFIAPLCVIREDNRRRAPFDSRAGHLE
ncbi:hypothetical protein GGX14DRAFT_564943 [Mycena pura]|uniref:F-box domain-containing protein n=1 Tax=Mycena pura TaxID=153505 RepID=A0AAD6VFU0_9AGAR|nr:hypothetical protein GGX14DRAFT_564943 [Mycena pura]